jgi:hypothetical protein
MEYCNAGIMECWFSKRMFSINRSLTECCDLYRCLSEGSGFNVQRFRVYIYDNPERLCKNGNSEPVIAYARMKNPESVNAYARLETLNAEP